MTRAPYDHEPVSLRDYFAGQAMAAIIGNSFIAEQMSPAKVRAMRDGVTAHEFERLVEYPAVATSSYRIADAMLAARQPSRTLILSEDFDELSVRSRNKIVKAGIVSFEQIVDDLPALTSQFDHIAAGELIAWRRERLASRVNKPTPTPEGESVKQDRGEG